MYNNNNNAGQRYIKNIFNNEVIKIFPVLSYLFILGNYSCFVILAAYGRLDILYSLTFPLDLTVWRQNDLEKLGENPINHQSYTSRGTWCSEPIFLLE